MAKQKKSREQLEKHLKEQIELLELVCDAYDSGKKVSAKMIASVVRTLVHDTDKSYSLLGLLSLKTEQFFDTCTSIGLPGQTDGYKRIGSFAGIVGLGIGSTPDYIPYLDEVPTGAFGRVRFDEYWNRVVLIDATGHKFTRRQLILTVTNEEGGAHVDPTINKKFDALANNNSMGWKVSTNKSAETDLPGIESATIRQIGHEILRTLKPDMTTKGMDKKGAGLVVGGMGIWIGTAIQKTAAFLPKKIPKVGRNEKCPCGSSKKYKKCHGT